jgi:hypothetical protein
MEISNYLKNKAEKLESIMVNEITKQKKLLNYDDIKEYKDELLDIQKYINELFNKLKKQEEPIKKKVVESEIEDKNEDEKENEKKDKYYLSAKKKRPQATESSIEYEAKILREKKITHEEHKESQKKLRELIKKTLNENKYESFYIRPLLKPGEIISYGFHKYYKIEKIDENKNKIISYQINPIKIGTLVADFPYCQNTKTYYLYDKNDYVVNEKNKLELPIIQTRGKKKGQQIEYKYVITNTGKFVNDGESYF